MRGGGVVSQSLWDCSSIRNCETENIVFYIYLCLYPPPTPSLQPLILGDFSTYAGFCICSHGQATDNMDIVLVLSA
jgi:hypothetical protein